MDLQWLQSHKGKSWGGGRVASIPNLWALQKKVNVKIHGNKGEYNLMQNKVADFLE